MILEVKSKMLMVYATGSQRNLIFFYSCGNLLLILSNDILIWLLFLYFNCLLVRNECLSSSCCLRVVVVGVDAALVVLGVVEESERLHI